ncbi:MAG: sigma-54-dependent Fis family transcriptional regulator, partial [Deltaproteobacteria bacterium]|nr:sigma-54-dependent Fis family transcriptional regulator [Deltaproteobacteria bacterium]
LFGHEKGAFTGADRQRKGRLEMAHTGTLFIDEIGDIPLSIQVKLLRTLQEKTITRVGGMKEFISDFRLIAATHRDLARMVADGSFREDLFYRINVVPIHIPPLRERKEDVALLARYFLDQYAAKYHHEALELSETNEAELSAYRWPGNIRELKNVMERTVLLSLEDRLEFNLPQSELPNGQKLFDDLPSMEEIQKRYILYVLEKTKGKQSGPDGAAEILGMKRSTLYNRMKKLGIS